MPPAFLPFAFSLRPQRMTTIFFPRPNRTTQKRQYFGSPCFAGEDGKGSDYAGFLIIELSLDKAAVCIRKFGWLGYPHRGGKAYGASPDQQVAVAGPPPDDICAGELIGYHDACVYLFFGTILPIPSRISYITSDRSLLPQVSQRGGGGIEKAFQVGTLVNRKRCSPFHMFCLLSAPPTRPGRCRTVVPIEKIAKRTRKEAGICRLQGRSPRAGPDRTTSRPDNGDHEGLEALLGCACVTSVRSTVQGMRGLRPTVHGEMHPKI
ncbi:uncharacterized protein LY79DRAFT_269465 [Colletotrichum navitas]|uniref:Uncharacterized protein n=1 Tax=Colletotrichum navitas TaxID=681940 RepID=A0AAD8PWC2_9PEZI|nr:uncharacterized protein LY79DRAFT_269465 [Colletotrichum navitas]KAK1585300.1 hypothetical protein LY79DRAFT_269465 [Colletotrichum navitas]